MECVIVFDLDLLAWRKEQTPGVFSGLFKYHLCDYSFHWGWEIKCIGVEGKGYALISGIMPSKSSARRGGEGGNEYESTLQRLSQVVFLNTEWKNKSSDSVTEYT